MPSRKQSWSQVDYALPHLFYGCRTRGNKLSLLDHRQYKSNCIGFYPKYDRITGEPLGERGT